MKKWLYFSILGLIVFLSFSFYSSVFYPALNSDNAITILMIHYFKLPNDLYFWSQDRMGSLIPLIAQIPDKILKIPPVTSESIVHYIILVLGFIAFSTFIKSKFYRLFFAIVWFFPPMHFIDLNQFAFGIHYSLIAIACYLLKLSEVNRIQSKPLLYHLVLFLVVLILITSIWVTDMALVSVAILLSVWSLNFYNDKKPLKKIFNTSLIYYMLGGVIAGYLFIHYAKGTAAKRVESITFSNVDTIWQTLGIFWITVKNLLIFKANEPFTSIYTYMALFVVGYALFSIPKLKFNEAIRKWGLIFILDAIILFGIIMISKWTFLNNVPRRYFTCTYIAFSFVLVLIFDNLNINKSHSRFLKIFVGITVLIGGAGTIYNLKYIWPKTLKPRVEVAREFEKLGEIGIIADYWNSYINSCANPDVIKATPHDKAGSIRNYKIVDEVFRQKNIYVIRDMWLPSFPDSLTEFGRVLIKDGNEFQIGNSNVCKYKKITANIVQ